MKLTHRIRLLMLQRHANNLLRVTKARRDYLNRPHQQSAHMVSYPVPQRTRDFGITPLYAVIVVSFIALAVYLNLHPEAAQAASCTQIASAK